jgi:hypothetical protein
MTELPLHHVIEHSIQIAWDYLERTGELDEPEIASKVLLDAVELMVRQGVRSRLLLEPGHYRLSAVQTGTAGGVNSNWRPRPSMARGVPANSGAGSARIVFKTTVGFK